MRGLNTDERDETSGGVTKQNYFQERNHTLGIRAEGVVLY
jgi:hypothetical protein